MRCDELLKMHTSVRGIKILTHVNRSVGLDMMLTTEPRFMAARPAPKAALNRLLLYSDGKTDSLVDSRIPFIN